MRQAVGDATAHVDREAVRTQTEPRHFNAMERNHLILKWAKDRVDISKRRPTSSQQFFEKCSSAPVNHYGNANLSHEEVSPHTVRTTAIQKVKDTLSGRM